MSKLWDLQMFSDEGAADIGTVDTGSVSTDSSIGSAGGSVETSSDPSMAEESFDSLIEGKYKADFDKKVQSIVKKRIKDSKSLESRVNQMTPVFEAYANRYGMDPTDEKGIIAKMLDDNYLYEEEAIQRGMDVETLKGVKQVERENAELRRFRDNQLTNMENQRKFDALQEQARELQGLYPGFDLDHEMENPEFERLAWKAGVPLKTVYQLIHQDEIMASGMQYAVQQTANKVAASVRSNGMRPAEGGANRQAASLSGTTSPRNWDKQKRAEIRERVRRGERVTFD